MIRHTIGEGRLEDFQFYTIQPPNLAYITVLASKPRSGLSRDDQVTGRQARMVPGKTTFWKTFAKRYAAGGRPKTWKRLS